MKSNEKESLFFGNIEELALMVLNSFCMHYTNGVVCSKLHFESTAFQMYKINIDKLLRKEVTFTKFQTTLQL